MGPTIRRVHVRLRGLVVVLAMFGIHGAVLFGAAGRLDLPMFWAMLGVWLAMAVFALLTIPADLLQERMRPGPGAKERWFRPALILLYIALLVTCGLDAGRFHDPSPVPVPLQIGGLFGFAGLMAAAMWAQRANPFFSSVVRIQGDRGQHVITGGPYRLVRHPGYAAMLLMPLMAALTLGSWIGVIFVVPIASGFIARTAIEDRALKAELPGYTDYAEQVRYRLVPGVW